MTLRVTDKGQRSKWPLLTVSCGRPYWSRRGFFFGIILAPWPVDEQDVDRPPRALICFRLTIAWSPWCCVLDLYSSDAALRPVGGGRR